MITVTHNGQSASSNAGYEFLAAFQIGDSDYVVLAFCEHNNEFVTWRGIPGNWCWGHHMRADFSGDFNDVRRKAWANFANRAGINQMAEFRD